MIICTIHKHNVLNSYMYCMYSFEGLVFPPDVLQHSQWAWARVHKIFGVSQYKQSPQYVQGKGTWDIGFAKGICDVNDQNRDCSFM